MNKQRITRDNYEVYALDYIEKQMSADQLLEMESFLNLNPDIRAEIEGVDIIRLQPNVDIALEDKDVLFKSRPKPYRFVLLAAVLLGLVGIGIWWLAQRESVQVSPPQIVETPIKKVKKTTKIKQPTQANTPIQQEVQPLNQVDNQQVVAKESQMVKRAKPLRKHVGHYDDLPQKQDFNHSAKAVKSGLYQESITGPQYPKTVKKELNIEPTNIKNDARLTLDAIAVLEPVALELTVPSSVPSLAFNVVEPKSDVMFPNLRRLSSRLAFANVSVSFLPEHLNETILKKN